MRYLKKTTVLSFLFLLFTALPARAHYIWLNVFDYTPAEKTAARFSVGWGHKFYNPAGDILTDKTMVGEICMVAPDGSRIAVRPVNDFQYKSADILSRGTYLGLIKRKEGFSTKTADGYKHQPRKGLENVIHSRYLGMYGKAIINVGAVAESPGVLKPVGDPLELVPLTNPSALESGDYFRFRLLFEGKPIAEYINATYAGFSTDAAWAYSARTNSKGIGEIRILQPGIWVIKANHKAPYPDPEQADEYSYTASLTFEVR